ncbi:unnamed protein product [Moneuplotes crassus]|uniref:Uncharacterized protein n=1 Tax=Euplotes crassus TaxID=5936 RepID=A0AAD2D823_EUPCR|nr:unnamed protein product [Moneuplotes crassus]
MEFDNITPRMKNGILLLDYFAEPEEFYKASSSVDLSFLRDMKQYPVSPTCSKVSKRSSYSGSRVDLDTLSDVKWSKISKLNEEKFDDMIIDSESSLLAQKYTARLLNRAHNRVFTQFLESEKLDDLDCTEVQPIVLDYLEKLYFKCENICNLNQKDFRKFSLVVLKNEEIDTQAKETPSEEKASSGVISQNLCLNLEGVFKSQETNNEESKKEVLTTSNNSISVISEVPNIQVVEDKSEFSVVRHLKGLPQQKEFKPVLSKKEKVMNNPLNTTKTKIEENKETPQPDGRRKSTLKSQKPLRESFRNITSKDMAPVIKKREKPLKITKKIRIHKKKNTKMSFMINTKHRIEVDLPCLSGKFRKGKKLIRSKIRPFPNKMRLMSPPVMNKNRLNLENQDTEAKYDKEKALLNLVFRKFVQENVIKDLISEVVTDSVRNVIQNAKMKRRRNRSLANTRKGDPNAVLTIKQNSNNVKKVKIKELLGKDFKHIKMPIQNKPVSVHTLNSQYDLQKKTLRKMKMLDLMTRKKLSRKKKKIIQTYGKDMISEMYLDLMNLSEMKRNEILMNFNKDRRGSSRIHQNEFDDPNYRFVDKSMFNQTRALQEGKEMNQKLIASQGKSLFKDLKCSIMDSSYRMTNRAKSSKNRKRVKRNHNKFLQNKTLHHSTSNHDRSLYKITQENPKRRVKSPNQHMKLLGLYTKKSMLEDVLKMYKAASSDYRNDTSKDESLCMNSQDKDNETHYSTFQQSDKMKVSCKKKRVKNSLLRAKIKSPEPMIHKLDEELFRIDEFR